MLLTFKGVEAVDKPDGSRATEVRMLNRVVPVSAITMGMVSSYFTAAKRGAFVSAVRSSKDESADVGSDREEQDRRQRGSSRGPTCGSRRETKSERLTPSPDRVMIP